MADQPDVQVTDTGNAPDGCVTVRENGIEIFVPEAESKEYVAQIYRDYYSQ